MLQAISAFTEFCYLARRSVLTDESIQQLEDALKRYYQFRDVFKETGVRPDGFSSLPRQHALGHYPRHIREFGAPNGLCSSITESKHIKAVKEPWRRSNKFEALGQMLLTNQRLDKLAAARADYAERGMLVGSLLYAVITAMEAAAAAAAAAAVAAVPALAGAQGGAQPAAPIPAEDNDEDEVVTGPRVLASVCLAKRSGM